MVTRSVEDFFKKSGNRGPREGSTRNALKGWERSGQFVHWWVLLAGKGSLVRRCQHM